MEKSKAVFKKRKFKRTFKRKLSMRDIGVLEFLWTWKVATTPMLKEVSFKNKSQWWVYKALRQLKNEKLIQVLPRGKHLEQELWALTESGFEVVLMDRDDIAHYRYKPHAPTHDFLATCLQLSNYWQSDVDCVHFTEQMLASLSPSNFPKGIREIKDHVPDGVTVFHGGKTDVVVGYEVDLNLKDESRYESTYSYYDQHGINTAMVVWLVRNKWIADKINLIIQEQLKREYTPKKRIFAFVLLEDFKQNLWEAKAINASVKGISLSKLHANVLQSVGKAPPKLVQKSFVPIFFPRHKSPQKLISYNSEVKLEIN